MRSTRTLAACVAATALVGLLSATPATAAPLDRAAIGVSRSAAAPAPAPSSDVTASLVNGHVIVSLPHEIASSDEWLMVRAGTRVLGQIQKGVAVGGDPYYTLDGRLKVEFGAAQPGERLDVFRLAGSLGDDVDAAPWIKKLADSWASDAPVESGLTASFVNGFAVVSVPTAVFAAQRRLVFRADGVEVGQSYGGKTFVDNGQDGRTTFLGSKRTDGDRTQIQLLGVRPGSRVEVSEYEGTAFDFGVEDVKRVAKLFDQQVGEKPGMTASLVNGNAVVSVPDEVLRTNKRLVVSVDGRDLGEIQGDEAYGTVKRWREGGAGLFEFSTVTPGQHLEVWEYPGTWYDSRDSALAKEKLLDQVLTATPPAPPAPAPAQPSFVKASLSGGRAEVTLPDAIVASDRRFVVVVGGKPVAETREGGTRGVAGVSKSTKDAETTFLIDGVNAGDRLEVWEYEGVLDFGFDDALRKAKVFDEQL
ncbi:hypothetical protein [Rathayibacter sp. VKM Ac-2760]|uniref:hypothetical protein n=1 Tax=Rathayibacter sp. VKM Ac-2760 TaxID=2609253 RepID=UPI0013194584|nr:hypothetical protein [Rathayibacter sp. VKM Ac-2760]QHC57553.1 hypothetical protein GSU72_02360 [Rathayibacter sp. VKM Ac-2760]